MTPPPQSTTERLDSMDAILVLLVKTAEKQDKEITRMRKDMKGIITMGIESMKVLEEINGRLDYTDTDTQELRTWIKILDKQHNELCTKYETSQATAPDYTHHHHNTI